MNTPPPNIPLLIPRLGSRSILPPANALSGGMAPPMPMPVGGIFRSTVPLGLPGGIFLHPIVPQLNPNQRTHMDSAFSGQAGVPGPRRPGGLVPPADPSDDMAAAIGGGMFFSPTRLPFGGVQFRLGEAWLDWSRLMTDTGGWAGPRSWEVIRIWFRIIVDALKFQLPTSIAPGAPGSWLTTGIGATILKLLKAVDGFIIETVSIMIHNALRLGAASEGYIAMLGSEIGGCRMTFEEAVEDLYRLMKQDADYREWKDTVDRAHERALSAFQEFSRRG